MATKRVKRRTGRVASRKRRYLEQQVEDIEEYLELNYEWARKMRLWALWVNRKITGTSNAEEVPPVPKWPRPVPKK